MADRTLPNLCQIGWRTAGRPEAHEVTLNGAPLRHLTRISLDCSGKDNLAVATLEFEWALVDTELDGVTVRVRDVSDALLACSQALQSGAPDQVARALELLAHLGIVEPPRVAAGEANSAFA